MKYWLFGLLAALSSGIASAAEPQIETPGLLPTSVARTILDQDPEVTAARAGSEVFKEEAALAKGSPYEWTVKYTAQKRKLEAGDEEYNEWNAALERTVRLPNKIRADKRIGNALLDRGEAEYGEALHETAKELLNLWLDWLAAEQAYTLTQANQQSTQDNLGIVQKQFKAGDAAKLEVALAQGELAEQQRASSTAKIKASVAWSKVHARFPGLTREYANLPEARPVNLPESYWRERISSQSDELKIAEAHYREAQANGERARADRVPDPTLGVFSASEFAGRERVVGLSISLPLSGSQRSAKARKAVQTAYVAHDDWILQQRENEARIAAAVATASGHYESWQLAEASAAALSENVRLMQRAYTLGEADLSTLLLARRQATAASLAALEAKVESARAYYSLLIDAHLVWDLDHEK
ncbi:MAG TPA: TolC family protein [Cellvibrionaceae bacterium]|nr:TolC family protein [Cellvibrionaceae bacterium]HNG61030.1 TolC family protein [Cellvibrionaceae bacterium]